MACLFLKERNKHVKEINQKYDCKILYTDGRVIKIYLISFSEIITIKQARNFYAGTCGRIYFVKSFATLVHSSYLYKFTKLHRIQPYDYMCKNYFAVTFG